MSLQGRGVIAYKNYMDKVLGQAPKVEEVKPRSGLLSRNKPVEPENKTDDQSDYLLDQFKILQNLRAGIANGKT